MPSCAYGAEPTAAAKDQQVWIDRFALAADVASLLSRAAPLTLVSLAASLVDVNAICEENPDPPEPLTQGDLLELAIALPFSSVLPTTKATTKLYAWMRYAEFLNNCVCKLPPAPTPGECPYVNATFHLESGQSTAPVPYAISDGTYASWAQLPGPGPGQWNFTATATVTSQTVPTTQRFVEWSSDQVVWHPFYEFRSSGVEPTGCHQSPSNLPDPRMPQTGFVRVRNNSAASNTWTNLNFCFCALAVTPKPLPPQPPIPTVPDAPATTCSTEDMCRIVTELARRLTNVAAQLSDVQAAVTGRDVLVVAGTTPISGEGEVSLPLGTKAIGIELQTLGPNAFTSALGRPRGLMRVGSIRYGDGTGYSPRTFIDADRYQSVLPFGALTVSWQLLPGTTGVLKFLG